MRFWVLLRPSFQLLSSLLVSVAAPLLSLSTIRFRGLNNFGQANPVNTSLAQIHVGWSEACGITLPSQGSQLLCWGQGIGAVPRILAGAMAPQFNYRTGAGLKPCPIGRVSTGIGAISSLCNGLCPAGRYGSTPSADPIRCGAPCPAGFYCPVGTGEPLRCPAGKFGSAPQSQTSDCTGPCPQGACMFTLLAPKCRLFVLGYYCPPQTTLATMNPCPKGRFGRDSGLQTANCSGICLAGYWCASIRCLSTELFELALQVSCRLDKRNTI